MRRIGLETTVRQLVHEARRRWQNNESGVCDDVTAIVVVFPDEIELANEKPLQASKRPINPALSLPSGFSFRVNAKPDGKPALQRQFSLLGLGRKGSRHAPSDPGDIATPRAGLSRTMNNAAHGNPQPPPAPLLGMSVDDTMAARSAASITRRAQLGANSMRYRATDEGAKPSAALLAGMTPAALGLAAEPSTSTGPASNVPLLGEFGVARTQPAGSEGAPGGVVRILAKAPSLRNGMGWAKAPSMKRETSPSKAVVRSHSVVRVLLCYELQSNDGSPLYLFYARAHNRVSSSSGHLRKRNARGHPNSNWCPLPLHRPMHPSLRRFTYAGHSSACLQT